MMRKAIPPPTVARQLIAEHMAGGVVWLSTRQVAEALGKSKRAVLTKCAKGNLVGARLDRRGHWQIPSIYSDLATYNAATAQPRRKKIAPGRKLCAKDARRIYDAAYLTGAGLARTTVAQALGVHPDSLSRMRRNRATIWDRGHSDGRAKLEQSVSAALVRHGDNAQPTAIRPPDLPYSLFRDDPLAAGLIVLLRYHELRHNGRDEEPAVRRARAAFERHLARMTDDQATVARSADSALASLGR